MKRRVLALTLILVALMVGTLGKLADANPTMFGKTRYCHISIESPKNGTTLNTQPIALNFTVTEVKMSSVYTYFYLLDTQDFQYGVRVQNLVLVSKETVTNDTFFPYERLMFAGGAILPILAIGSHNLTIFIGYAIGDGTLKAANVEPFSTTISFNIDNKTVTPSQTPGISNVPHNQDDLAAYFVVAVPIVIVAVIASLSLVYFKRRKGKQ
jgi:hypothetical protein